ncbi:hypothetical protein BDR07DRAFT_1007082 [Suillus spraguei]|nr:hypothetical protein BDR07DRAFT_1007082 [Suillus spraguei]
MIRTGSVTSALQKYPHWCAFQRRPPYFASSTSPVIPTSPAPHLLHSNPLNSYYNAWFLYRTMPSTFSLGTYTAMFSSILMSLSLPLHLASDPPPYNHTQSSHHNCSRKNGRSQDLLIPVTASCLIHIPKLYYLP